MRLSQNVNLSYLKFIITIMSDSKIMHLCVWRVIMPFRRVPPTYCSWSSRPRPFSSKNILMILILLNILNDHSFSPSATHLISYLNVVLSIYQTKIIVLSNIKQTDKQKDRVPSRYLPPMEGFSIYKPHRRVS